MADSLANPNPADPTTTDPTTAPEGTNTGTGQQGDPQASADSPASTGEPAPDYRALYEATLTKLTQAQQTAKANKDKARKLDDIEAAQLTDAEKATARAAAAEQQLGNLRRLAVDAEIRAAATGWADPTDAPLYLVDRDRYLSEDGAIDTAAITADLAGVLVTRPHLARVDGPRRPAPDPSQGARNTGPAGTAAQIRDAESRGDWAAAIRLKNQKLGEQARQQRTS